MFLRAGREFNDLKLASTALSLAVGVALLSCLMVRPAFVDLTSTALYIFNRLTINAEKQIALESPGCPATAGADTLAEFDAVNGSPKIVNCVSTPAVLPADLPAAWDVRGAFNADLTRDGVPELVLLVWRPWRDVPYMEWTTGPSPVAGFHDNLGDSCHVILIDTDPDVYSRNAASTGQSYREIWAGSPLPTPVVQIAADDVDGDKTDELITLEGDYKTGRYNPSGAVSVWKWNGFGFTMLWRNDASPYSELGRWNSGSGNTTDILIGVPF